MDAGPVASFPGTERVHGSRGARGRQPVWGARGRHSLSVPVRYCTERRHSSEEGGGREVREKREKKEERRKATTGQDRQVNRQLNSEDVCPCRKLREHQDEPQPQARGVN